MGDAQRDWPLSIDSRIAFSSSLIVTSIGTIVPSRMLCRIRSP